MNPAPLSRSSTPFILSALSSSLILSFPALGFVIPPKRPVPSGGEWYLETKVLRYMFVAMRLSRAFYISSISFMYLFYNYIVIFNV